MAFSSPNKVSFRGPGGVVRGLDSRFCVPGKNLFAGTGLCGL